VETDEDEKAVDSMSRNCELISNNTDESDLHNRKQQKSRVSTVSEITID
jgi:hypothetical protein